MVAGSIRRKVEDTSPLNVKDLAVKIQSLSTRDSCLIALLYLSGRRINEVLPLGKRAFHVESKRISFETFNEKVYRKKQGGNFQIEIGDKYYEKIRPHWRTDTDSGELLSCFVTARLEEIGQDDYLFQRLYKPPEPIEYRMGYQIIRKNFPDLWPHLLRHERFTEVAKVYRDDPVSMHRFTFHKRFESTLQYIRNLEEEKI